MKILFYKYSKYPQKGLVAILLQGLRLYVVFQDAYVKWKLEKYKTKVIKCTKLLEDVKHNKIEEIIFKEHTLNNHRGIEEVFKELKLKYYYPKLKDEISKIINNCQTFQLGKYDRNPIKEPFKARPFPSGLHEQICVDIWYLEKGCKYITAVDRFSKYAAAVPLKSKNWPHVKMAVETIITIFNSKLIIINNESTLKLNLENFLWTYNIEAIFTTPNSHTGNSDIERFHNTLNKHMRIMIIENPDKIKTSFVRTALRSYNSNIHKFC